MSDPLGHNTLIGDMAGHMLIRGDYNVAIGAGALKNLRSGSYNIAIGKDALADIIEGDGWIELAGQRIQHLPLAKKLIPYLANVADEALRSVGTPTRTPLGEL